jgi:hypothetical protein
MGFLGPEHDHLRRRLRRRAAWRGELTIIGTMAVLAALASAAFVLVMHP